MELISLRKIGIADLNKFCHLYNMFLEIRISSQGKTYSTRRPYINPIYGLAEGYYVGEIQ